MGQRETPYRLIQSDAQPDQILAWLQPAERSWKSIHRIKTLNGNTLPGHKRIDRRRSQRIMPSRMGGFVTGKKLLGSSHRLGKLIHAATPRRTHHANAL